MNRLEETAVSCPSCGERITILVDGSVEEQQYVEDCEVCCRPMDIHVNVSSNGGCLVEARSESDCN